MSVSNVSGRSTGQHLPGTAPDVHGGAPVKPVEHSVSRDNKCVRVTELLRVREKTVQSISRVRATEVNLAPTMDCVQSDQTSKVCGEQNIQRIVGVTQGRGE